MTTTPFNPCIDGESSAPTDSRESTTSRCADVAAPGACCEVGVDQSAYTALLSRLQDRLDEEGARAGRDRDRGAALLDSLMEFPADEREDAIAREERFGSFSLADHLLDAAEAVFERDRSEAVELVELALAVAARLERDRWRRGLLADLEARAWALLGETWCRLGSEEASRTAFRLARSRLQEGSGDPLQEADVLFREAAPRRGDDPSTALSRADRAAALFLEYGDPGRLGESLARKGTLAAMSDDHRTAEGVLREALALLDGASPVRRRAEIGWLLARSLLAQGAADEAWTEIARARSCLREEPDGLIEARLRLLEGQIAELAGLRDEARACLREATDALLELGEPEEAARAHLARVALEQSEGAGTDPRSRTAPSPAEREHLGTETDRLLATGRLSRETILALLLVDRAADAGTLRPDLVTALTGFLDRAG